MAQKKARKNQFIASIIEDARTTQKRETAYTPFIAIVVALFLNRLNFVSFLNSVIRWDETQWKVSPGNLAKAIFLTPFLSIGARIPIYAIHETFESVVLSHNSILY